MEDRQRRIQNPVKYQRWNFLAKIVNGLKPLTNSQKAPSNMFDWILNTPLEGIGRKSSSLKSNLKNH